MYRAAKYYIPIVYKMKAPNKVQSVGEQGLIPIIDGDLLFPQSNEVKIRSEKLINIASILSP